VKLSDVMSAAGLTSWAEVALVISFLTFVAIVVYVFWRRRPRWEHARHLPLEGDASTDEREPTEGEDR
jgi:cbb3-type cytochrome oxidase subunit 3